MPFACALSTAAATRDAARQACEDARAELGARPDLAVAFYSPHHLAAVRDLAHNLHQHLGAQATLGCVAETVIANGREVERGPALSVWLAKWARPVAMRAFHLVLE